MSDNADFSIWSTDEIELLDNINKEIKLGNSGSDTDSSKLNQSSKESWKVLQSNDTGNNVDGEKVRQSGENSQSQELINQQSNISVDRLKLHFSSNDLSNLNVQNVPLSESSPNNVTPFSHSVSYNCLSNNEKPSSKKYDHIESKVKQYFHVKNQARDVIPSKETEEMNEIPQRRQPESEDYLKEINMRLTKELEEKNALITKLQENYENLLLKYAEAQNKIDQLRLKTVCEPSQCQIHSSQKQNYPRTVHSPVKIFSSNKEHQNSWDDAKCQKAVVAPFVKDDFQSDPEIKKTDRPSSLPLEPKMPERDVIKAGTPTDSEGVSSVITSMSGHSKILNTLDVHSPNGVDSKLIKYPDRDFILADNSVVHDAFNKVKNWQNSLPPLELIETPETTLYDESPMQISPSANYPKENSSDEEVFPSNCNLNSEPLQGYNENDASQTGLKDYLRTLSLPSAFKKKNTIPVKQQKNTENGQNLSSKRDCIIQRHKKPPLLRCSSLPTYDTPKSSKRNIYIPPLDLENLTLSDVESSQVDYYDYDQMNRGTSSSYVTSQSGSIEFSSQTYRSNYKERMMEYSDFQYSGRPSFNKSTSITPERCNDLLAPKLNNFCRVCGEKLEDRSFPCRSNSYQTFQDVKDAAAVEKRGKYPFSRSVSFNSETSSLRRCYHTQDCFLRRQNEDSLEKFDIYTNNLKARSQVVMKALAAHVNNT